MWNEADTEWAKVVATSGWSNSLMASVLGLWPRVPGEIPTSGKSFVFSNTLVIGFGSRYLMKEAPPIELPFQWRIRVQEEWHPLGNVKWKIQWANFCITPESWQLFRREDMEKKTREPSELRRLLRLSMFVRFKSRWWETSSRTNPSLCCSVLSGNSLSLHDRTVAKGDAEIDLLGLTD